MISNKNKKKREWNLFVFNFLLLFFVCSCVVSFYYQFICDMWCVTRRIKCEVRKKIKKLLFCLCVCLCSPILIHSFEHIILRIKLVVVVVPSYQVPKTEANETNHLQLHFMRNQVNDFTISVKKLPKGSRSEREWKSLNVVRGHWLDCLNHFVLHTFQVVLVFRLRKNKNSTALSL